MTFPGFFQSTLRGGFLAAALLSLSARAHGQITTSFSAAQKTSTVPTAITENFANATVTPGSTAGTGTYTTLGDALNGNLNFTTLGTNSFTTTVSGQASAPTGNASDRFLVIGTGTGQTASVTMTFTNDTIHYFGLLWGSADNGGSTKPSNTIVLNLLNNTTNATTALTFTTGSIGLVGGSNDFVNFATTSNAYSITSAVLSYNAVAFEVDNITYGVVPEAGTGVSVLLLVGGAVWLAHRQTAHRVAA